MRIETQDLNPVLRSHRFGTDETQQTRIRRPQVREAVVGEVVGALGGARARAGGAPAPDIDHCAMCVDRERARTRQRAAGKTLFVGDQDPCGSRCRNAP